MSYYTQRLANRFPRWTKIRRDPSSLGQRLLSGIALNTQERSIENAWLAESWSLLANHLGTPVLYQVKLVDEEFSRYVNDGGGVMRTPPTVTGTIGIDTRSLVFTASLEELTTSPPDFITVEDTEPYTGIDIWSSEAGFITSPITERLAIVVSGSTDYYEHTRPGNSNLSGRHSVYIRGYDENGLPISETVDVPDDGVYLTTNWWSDVLEVDYEGFDGEVLLRLPALLPYIQDPYKILALDTLEGPLRMELIVEDGVSHVMLVTPKLKAGEAYRHGSTVVDNRDLLGYLLLRNSDSEDIELVDLAVSPENGLLYGVEASGLVHVWEHALPTFSAPAEDLETLDTYIELHSDLSYVAFGSTTGIWTYFARIRSPLKAYRIKRRAPDGTIRWLTEARTWSATETVLPCSNHYVAADGSFTDYRFETVYDQVGQWEYTCFVKSELDETTYQTAVLVPELVALSSLDTGVADVVGCYFSQRGKLAVLTDTTVNYVSEWVDRFYTDYDNQRILLQANYDEVEVTV